MFGARLIPSIPFAPDAAAESRPAAAMRPHPELKLNIATLFKTVVLYGLVSWL